MKIVCIICTERLVVNDSISVCTCGHLFHEQCLFRWFKSTGPNTCPQCRAKQTEKNVIKRLFFNQEDITVSQANVTDVTPENLENLQNLVGELKNSLLELRQAMTAKEKLVELKDAKLKEMEKASSNTKKTLSENKLLLDYLKKELENYSKIKEQIEAKDASIQKLESKIREYKSIEMIYREHESTFANEMLKYLEPVNGKQNNISHYESVVRQLVNINVLLKENADKQMEEKRIIRKKLLQVEGVRADKEKRIEKLEKEFGELQSENEKIIAESKKNQVEFEAWKKKAQSLLARRAGNVSVLQQSLSTPTLNKENLIVNDTIQIDDFEVNSPNTYNNINKTGNISANVSGNFLDLNIFGTQENELNSPQADASKLEANGEEIMDDDIIEMRCNSMFKKFDIDIDLDSPQPKRRKNPFVSYDLNDMDKIPAEQPLRSKFAKFKSANELSLSQRFRDSPVGEVKIVKPIVSKRPRIATIDLEASSVEEVQVTKKVNAFSYLSDGFGGRTKVLNKNDKIMPLGGIKLGGPATKKSNFLTKSKFSK